MEYTVVGASRETGEDVEIKIAAGDALEAQDRANRLGLLVKAVRANETNVGAAAVAVVNVTNASPSRMSTGSGASLVFGLASILLAGLPGAGQMLGLLAVLLGVAGSFSSRKPGVYGFRVAVAGIAAGAVGIVAGLVLANLRRQ